MRLFTYNIQLSDGSRFQTWDRVHAEGTVMPWLLTPSQLSTNWEKLREIM